MFRASDMTTSTSTPAATQARQAINTLVRNLTRLYESMNIANEDPELWKLSANLIWTHMIQTRTLMTGFNAELAFVSEARLRLRSSTPSHASLGTTSSSPSASGTSAHPAKSHSPMKSHWFICPCCATPNDHFSPSCPSQSEGPTPIPKATRIVTRTAINNADIPQTAKTDLLRMAASLYAKLDRNH